MTVTDARKFLENNAIKFAGAVRRYPWRAEDESGAGLSFRGLADHRRRICRIRDLGSRHGTARSRVHGGGRSFDAGVDAVDTGVRANHLRWSRARQAVRVLSARCVAHAAK